MYDLTYFGSGGSYPRCCCCNKAILDHTRGVWIEFATDPDGRKGLTGHYHRRCGKPFQEMSKVIDISSFSRF